METPFVTALELQIQLLLINEQMEEQQRLRYEQMIDKCIVKFNLWESIVFRRYKNNIEQLHSMLYTRLPRKKEFEAMTYAILLLHDSSIPITVSVT